MKNEEEKKICSTNHYKIKSAIIELLLDPKLMALDVAYDRDLEETMVTSMTKQEGGGFILNKVKLWVDDEGEIQSEDYDGNFIDEEAGDSYDGGRSVAYESYNNMKAKKEKQIQPL